jgi:hypothetical protein
MNPPSQDIKDFLVAAGVGTFGTDLFVSKEPAADADGNIPTTTVYDTGGFDPEAQYVYDRPTVQVRVRGARGGYLAAYAKAQAARTALRTIFNETKNGTRYIGIWILGDIVALGDDEKGRPVLTLNIRIHRTA